MSRWRFVLAAALTIGWTTTATATGDLLPLRVLYVGNAKSERAGHFATFLKQHFTKVTVADRASFQPGSADDADVVLFDWLQSDSPLKETPIPFGKLETWSKPTVLFAHAGLLLAGQWQTIGGAG